MQSRAACVALPQPPPANSPCFALQYSLGLAACAINSAASGAAAVHRSASQGGRNGQHSGTVPCFGNNVPGIVDRAFTTRGCRRKSVGSTAGQQADHRAVVVSPWSHAAGEFVEFRTTRFFGPLSHSREGVILVFLVPKWCKHRFLQHFSQKTHTSTVAQLIWSLRQKLERPQSSRSMSGPIKRGTAPLC